MVDAVSAKQDNSKRNLGKLIGTALAQPGEAIVIT